MRALKEVFSWGITILIAVAVAIFINLFIFQPHEVVGESMLPTLKSGNIGIMSKISHTFSIEPNYNDIVIIDSRVDHKHTIKDDLVDTFSYNIISKKFFNRMNTNYWIKRVIGKPGDTIEIKDNKLYRNGKLLDEPYIREPMNNNSDKIIVVPEKHIFVMGDNRNYSKDSRSIGPVPLENVIGKLLIKF